MSFIANLKERKLVQWSLAYIAAAFALLQVIDIVGQQFDWPAVLQRGLTLLMVVGFFVVVLLAWFHGERGAQRVSGTEVSLLSLILLMGAGLVWFFSPETTDPANDGAGMRVVEALPILSIAVLPLDNYSGDPSQDYFAEGMTDQLTAELAMISSLRVISRGSTTQFKGEQRAPTPDIARILNVDAIIEGSVLRIGDRVRITAQLIDARQDKHLWAKSFDGNSADVLGLQDELASAIAREIDVQLTPEEATALTSAPSVIPKAYDVYLQGRYFFNRPSDDNLSKAINQFEKAIRLDPEFAPAYSGLSDAYLWAGYNESVFTASEARIKAKDAAEKAVRLDVNSTEANTSQAVFRFFYEYDWAGSETQFRRVIDRNPNYAFAHDQFALMLAFTSRFDESITASQRALALDPMAPQISIDAIFAYAWRGEYELAREQAARAAYLDPSFFFAPWADGWIDLQAGNAEAAIPHFLKADAMESPLFAIAWLGYARGVTGDKLRALDAIDELNEKSLRGYVSPFNLAIVHLGLGEADQAITYLEQAYAMDSQWLGWLGNDRIYDPLRSHPRFKRLIKKLGLEG